MVAPPRGGRLHLRRHHRGVPQHDRPAHPGPPSTTQAGGREQLIGRTLADLIAFDAVAPDVFQVMPPADDMPRLFGGLIAAQALAAAWRTVEGRMAHSLHGYFLRMGSQEVPVTYEVERTRDGGSYTSRRVVARQGDSVIFTMAASFHGEERGLEHQVAMPRTAGPEGLPLMSEVLGFPARSSTFEVIELRMPESFGARERKVEPEEHRQLWFRSARPLSDDRLFHAALLTFASDLLPSLIVMVRHGVLHSQGIETASLDHAVWFHRPVRADQWICYDQSSPVAYGGRGMFTGRMFTEDGILVATVVQEVMLRVAR